MSSLPSAHPGSGVPAVGTVLTCGRGWWAVPAFLRMGVVLIATLLGVIVPAGAAFILTPSEAELEEMTEPVRRGYAAFKAGDVDEGVAIFRAEADKGDPAAQFAMAILHQEGQGLEQSPAKAVEWYTKAAEQGHMPSQFNLGTLLLNDPSQAAQGIGWIEEAARAGSGRAKLFLARCHINGMHGLEKDWIRAERQLIEAAGQSGGAEAALQLAALYDADGEGWNRRSDKAVEWLNRAVVMGLPAAMIRLGDKFGAGDGVDQDTAKARALYREASENGAPEALLRLAAACEREEDWAGARRWYEKAIEEGQFEAYSRLGQFHEKGLGVEADLAKALETYRTGAEKGVAVCMHNLGVFYNTGTGVEEDPTQAAKWFFEAAARGILESQNQLAAFYREGRGVMRDPIAAAAWFDRAARGGHALAQVNLGSMLESGEAGPPNPGAAAKLYERAASRRFPVALYRLGLLMENGRGVERDPVKAYALYSLADGAGFEAAKARLEVLAESLTDDQKKEAEDFISKLESGEGASAAAPDGE